MTRKESAKRRKRKRSVSEIQEELDRGLERAERLARRSRIRPEDLQRRVSV